MVLDIRELRREAALIAETPPAGPDMDQLLACAAGMRPGDQARAIEELRLLVPSPAGLERLLEIAADAADKRRQPAG